MNFRDMSLQLQSRRIVFLAGDLDDDITAFISRQLSELCMVSDQKITLVIDSPGGRMENAFRIHDFIAIQNLPVTGLVMGLCESAAVIVLMGCQKRLATPHSTFLMHQVNAKFHFVAGAPKKEYVGMIDAQMRQAARYESMEQMILRKRTHLTVAMIRRLKENGESYGERLTAHEALAYGLVDGIVNKFSLFDHSELRHLQAVFGDDEDDNA